MEWHKAKNIMLALLILVNLVLLGSRAYMSSTERREQQAAAAGAVEYLNTIGITLEPALIPLQSPERSLCIIPRNRDAEAAFAELLLGSSEPQVGGSIDRYASNSGQVVWRHGGQVEVQSPEVPTAETLMSKLENCRADGQFLTQEIDGLPVFNCTLEVMEGKTIHGRWCFGEPALLDNKPEMTAAGLLIAYGGAVRNAPPSEITALDYGYVVQSVPTVGVRLVPVLRLTADGESVYLNALDGEVLIVE